MAGRLARPASVLPGRKAVAELHHQHALVGSPRSVGHPRRPATPVHPGGEGLPEAQIGEVPLDDEDLFPELVPERPVGFRADPGANRGPPL